VAGEGQKVDALLLNVDRQGARRLGRVDADGDSMVVAIRAASAMGRIVPVTFEAGVRTIILVRVWIAGWIVPGSSSPRPEQGRTDRATPSASNCRSGRMTELCSIDEVMT
jgi:hypothetical protein